MILPQDPVQAAIVLALNNCYYDDAIFLGERLFAEASTDSTLFLLASCYYQAGKKSQAYRFLRNNGYPTARCKYLFSMCCFDVGKLNEAELILTNESPQKPKTVKEFSDEYGDTAPFAISLLADIYRKTERPDKALEYYYASLSLNPFLWSSFSNICKLGGKPDPEKIFQAGHVQQAMNSVKSVLFSPYATVGSNSLVTPKTKNKESCTSLLAGKLPLIDSPGDNISVLEDSIMSHEAESTAFHTPANGSNSGFSASSPPMVGKLFISELHDKQTLISPSFGTLPLDTPIAGTYDSSFATPAFVPISFKDIPSAPTKKVTCAADSQPMVSPASVSRLVFGKSSTSNTTKPDMLVVPSPTAYHTNLSIPRRRSKRILDSQSSSSVKENSKMQTRGSHTSLRSTIRKARSNQNIKLSDEVTSKNKYNSSIKRPSTTATSTVEALDIKQKQSASAFLSLLRDLGAAYLASHTFDIKKCVDLFEAVPSHHYKTGWVLAEAGRAYLEMAEYHKAREVFDELRKLEPHQINGMETYSTVLFHLQDEVALSTLAQDMVEIDKHCAQTWCVNGNCFSLQKEHETAIKFLQRAIQIDPCFTYAYTLLGHEYTITEDYDKAMSAFRNAIRVDSRHYNAWYGLGMIFYKREKFTLAEAHFKKALLINPQSAVLLCHIGLVQHALQKHVLALETLNQAVEMSPRNPMCLFHRASMLVANDKLEQALKELESLKALTPKESLVYFLIGKVHKKLGNAHLSMLNFSWATDLDPKGANNHIKEAIDRRYVTDEEDQEHSLSVDASILMADTPSETLSTDTSVMDSDEAHHHLQANESDDSL